MAMMNGQSRNTGNIGNKTERYRKLQRAMMNGQSRDTGNIGNKTKNEDKITKKPDPTKNHRITQSTKLCSIDVREYRRVNQK